MDNSDSASYEDPFAHTTNLDTICFGAANTADCPPLPSRKNPQKRLSNHMAQVRGLSAGMHLLNKVEPITQQTSVEVTISDALVQGNRSNMDNAAPPPVTSEEDMMSRFALFLNQLGLTSHFLTCQQCLQPLASPTWSGLRDHFLSRHAPGWHIEAFEMLFSSDMKSEIQQLLQQSTTSDPLDDSANGKSQKRSTEGIDSSIDLAEAVRRAATEFTKLAGLLSDQEATRERLSAAAAAVLRTLGGNNRKSKAWLHTQNESTLKRLGNMAQWKTMKRLRREFYSRHSHFLRLASNSPGELSEFAQSCPRPKDLLDEAILTYRDILDDEPPTALRGVFAFISLSYAVDAVLHCQNMQSFFSPSPADFRLWRKSIPDYGEKRVFDQLASLIWLPRCSPAVPDGSSLHFDQGQGLGESMQVAVDGILDSMERSPDFRFSVFEEFCNFDEAATSTPWPIPDELLPDSESPSLYRNCEALDESGGSEVFAPDIALDLDNQITGMSSQEYILETPLPALGNPPAGKELAELLLATIIFRTVRSFIEYLYAAGTLLHHLSGKEEYRKPLVKSRSSIEITSYALFVTNAHWQVLVPLLRTYQSLHSVHLALSTCLALLHTGWICSLDGVRNYAIGVAQSLAALFDGESVFPDFIIELLRRCSNAASQINPRFHCIPAGGDVPMYDLTCIDSRMTQEISDDGSSQQPSTQSTACGNHVMAITSEPCITNSEQSLECNCSVPGSAESRHRALTPSTASFTPLSAPHSTSIQPQFRVCGIDGCNKRYNGPDASSNLRRHKREKHDGKRFPCPFSECPHISARRSNLKTHWKRHHRGLGMPHCLTSR
ncbi:hypothetical protein BJX68DRAFT_229495 [Aspergillus pseudodeflectus]|uniref:C2H2-type domain-containing protein n=1 Tax=Aspergillus pseudodeflectus TaxID=176178 RepID=A0ABR4KX00_9EURO